MKKLLCILLALAMLTSLTLPSFAEDGTYFTDVNPDAAYYDAVKWAANAGVVKGKPDGSFGAGSICTLQEVITMLWRAAGSVETGIGTNENDKAVSWLERQSGWALDLLQTSAPVTRAGFVELLYAALGDRANIEAELPFTDLEGIEDSFASALSWACAKGLVEGDGDAAFGPSQQMTREEIVAVLQRCFEKGLSYTVTQQELPLYVMSPEYSFPVTVAFFDGQTDIPYISVENLRDLLVNVYGDPENPDSSYQVTLLTNGDRVTLQRENGYAMHLDFDTGTISFWDYDAFLRQSSEGTVMKSTGITLPTEDAAGQPAFFQILDSSSERYGKALTMNLSAYGLRMIRQGDDFYIPFQTANDVLFALNGYTFLYNDQCFILYPDETLEEMFYSAPTGSRSPALALFTYKELCFALDQFYGLKAQHNISSFAEELKMNGLMNDLQSTDPATADAALAKLTDYYFDDGHSGFQAPSWLEGPEPAWESAAGASSTQQLNTYKRLKNARDAAFPEGVPGYQELGDTAYITFDEFTYEGTDYYQTPPDETTTDTIGLMIYAYSRITREDSPVKNVVLDLSMNSGGAVISAAYTIGTILGQSSVSVRNTLTDALLTENCRVDPNLDRVFDDADSLLNYNLFCLTSPWSFSCGNLVPSILKSSHRVTMLGQTSGGGSCEVLFMVTADGARFQISGPYCMSFLKNGAFYDIDQGVDPDHVINNYEHFYDREALTEYIHSLY